MRSRLCRIGALICFAALATNLFGQAISGDVTGVISDKTGGVIASATVTAVNEATGVKSTTSTNTVGVYRFGNLPVGSYTITASAKGFTTASVKGLQVVLSNVITANLTLDVGSTATTVEVSAAAAAIDTTTAQVQNTFESRQTIELPTAANSTGAGIWNLSLIGAGVASQGGVGQGTGPSIAGQRAEDNTFMLDGVSNVNHYSTGPLVYTSNEAVAEVSLLQNQFSPEFGGGSGGVFNAVAKSGTNSIHGSIYEYLQNRNLNAVDALQWTQGLTSPPRFDNNRLGATIGGPIRKNKLFYFGNFEYNPVGQSAVPGSPLEAPTSAGMSTLSSIAGISTTNLGWFQKWVPVAPSNNAGSIKVTNPLIPGSTVYTIPIGALSFASPTYTNNYYAVVSIDYNISDKDQLRGRWIYNKTNGLDSSANLPAFFSASPNDNYLYSVSEFHSFTPTFQNEFRGSFSRNFNSIQVGNQTFPGMSVIPNIQIDDLNTLQIGPDPNTPSGSIQNLFQLQDNGTKIIGKHTLKFGYHFTDVILTNYFIQRVRGDYDYLTLQQYLFDLTPDDLGERSAGPTSYPCGFLENEAFFNDDYRILPNLTLNLGLRYEYVTIPVASRYQMYSSPANVPGGIAFNEPKPSNNEWSPRLGFAWSPGSSSTWSVRGGFSRAFDPTYANLTSNAAPPYFQQTNDVNLSSNAPNFLKNGGLPGTAQALPTDARGALALVGSYTFGGKRPYGVTWNLGVQRVFHHDYTFEARYVGTKGVHLWNQTRLNMSPLVSSTNSIPTYFSMPSAATFASLTKTLGQVESYIVPGATAGNPYNFLASLGSASAITSYAPQAYSSYNGLALQLTRRFAHNFQYILAYTWSHTEDDGTATNFSTYLTPRRAQDFQNLAADWSSSALDHRQRLTFTPIYDWKAFESKGWLMKNVVSNWTFAGTYTYETAEYATVQSGLDSNLNNDSAGDRTFINPAGVANVGSGVTGYNAQGQPVAAGSASIVAYVANIPNARYVVGGSGTNPDGGRNTFPLHPTNNIDLSIKKRFAFGESRSFDIGAQFFNVLNHAQFTGSHVSDVNSYGYIGSRNDLIPSNAAFGRFDEFYTSNSRTAQITAHFTF
jgi:hypothetical protein